MTEKDLQKIKEVSQSAEIAPSSEVWQRIQKKRNHKSLVRKLHTYRNIAIAAVFVAVLSVTAILTLYMNQRNPKLFTSNEDFRPMVFEELDIDGAPQYNINDIHRLNNAYKRINLQ